jgi:hypothetical protein
MHTQRTTHLLRRVIGLAAVPALVLTAAACGDDDEGSAGSFCEQAEALENRMDEIEDPTTEEFSAALDEIRKLDPPAEIRDDWNTMISALDGFEDIDFENPSPEDLAAFDAEGMQEASDNVDRYMDEECGL